MRGGDGYAAWPSVKAVLIGFACLLPAVISGQRQVTTVSLILFWTWVCVSTVLAGRMLLWALFTVGPLALVSLAYWLEMRSADHSAGLQGTLATCFIILSFITAGTGVLSIVLTAVGRDSPKAAGPDEPGTF